MHGGWSLTAQAPCFEAQTLLVALPASLRSGLSTAGSQYFFASRLPVMTPAHLPPPLFVPPGLLSVLAIRPDAPVFAYETFVLIRDWRASFEPGATQLWLPAPFLFLFGAQLSASVEEHDHCQQNPCRLRRRPQETVFAAKESACVRHWMLKVMRLLEGCPY